MNHRLFNKDKFPALKALRTVRLDGGVGVELERHSIRYNCDPYDHNIPSFLDLNQKELQFDTNLRGIQMENLREGHFSLKYLQQLLNLPLRKKDGMWERCRF